MKHLASPKAVCSVDFVFILMNVIFKNVRKKSFSCNCKLMPWNLSAFSSLKLLLNSMSGFHLLIEFPSDWLILGVVAIEAWPACYLAVSLFLERFKLHFLGVSVYCIALHKEPKQQYDVYVIPTALCR
jgi:hypothetical protein